MRRLSRAGFKKEFVRPAILPDWWEESCEDDPSLLQDIDIRVARFLGLPLGTVKDATAPLAPAASPQAQLRRVRDVDRDRLGPAIHTAMRIAAAVVRSLHDTVPDAAVPPPDGLAWRKLIERAGATATLNDIAADLWKRGIPVVPLDVYAKATMAVKALYRSTGARRQLRQLFDRHVHVDGATECDRALLRCVYGDREHDEAAH